jgi:hypothetical protein
MNKITKYLISIDRNPHLNGKKISQATPCLSYNKPAWFISFYDGYTTETNPVFTDEDGLNGAPSIMEYAKNLGFDIEE